MVRRPTRYKIINVKKRSDTQKAGMLPGCWYAVPFELVIQFYVANTIKCFGKIIMSDGDTVFSVGCNAPIISRRLLIVDFF